MGKKLTVYLIDGKDNGPRTIEIGNWSGKAIHTPRAVITKYIDRPEYDKPGIYILKSDPQDDIYPERIYIGEAEKLRNRIKQHLADENRDFKECIVFVSKDDMLTKSHVKYLESALVKMAHEAKNAEIDNATAPSLPTLSEADISDMKFFLDEIKLILPTAGYYFLLSNRISANKEEQPTPIRTEETVFQIRKQNLSARMIETDEGFMVLEGSEAEATSYDSLSDGYKKLKEKLIKEGSLKVTEGNKLTFTEDVSFSSSSAAACMVTGRSSSGPLDWIGPDGKNLKAYEVDKVNKKVNLDFLLD